MFTSKTLLIYRIIALLMLCIPTGVNIYIKGDIVSSIIYLPLITLALSGVAIFIDGKLEGLLTKGIVLTTITLPTTSIYLPKSNDVMIKLAYATDLDH
jgi:hypothetical protein